jgi:hypothetical protein
MTKQEALQLFASHVDIPALMADFPNLDWVATELEDGQQEIVIRLQGVDTDFHPTSDVNNVRMMTIADLPEGKAKNRIVLDGTIAIAIEERYNRRDRAILKRIVCLAQAVGISLRRIVRVLEDYISTEGN